MHDPFTTLGLLPAFDLDVEAAEKRHRELSRALHPDRYAQSPPAERRAALGKAIEVNEAWRTLRDPIRRGEALLRRMGLHVDEGQEPRPDPALLMEMMEKREELALAGRQRDAARLGALVKEMKEREAKATAALSAEFRRAADNGGAGSHAAALQSGLGELRYYRRFLDEAATLEDEIL
ncbi:MAG: Fe-S protein assembly co-chaperone HscB [Polyangiaceae bacterium]|nr:Fe-S protein assembly co-chaperone HscB [Polyangiaceae bacterium]MCE7890672.1 Fe-S protein assembly co-chaperone HscB [Sorangiineae bacterium PRO1]MCL4750260.1 Fe-S protein assembly co-chaperone HscB [Myxococcales bacterium]